jgi:AraC-like DNA-binding protein
MPSREFGMKILDAKPVIIPRSHVLNEVSADSTWRGDCPVLVDVPQPGRSVPDYSDQMALAMVVSGECCCRFDRRRYVIRTGQILVIPPNFSHVTSFDSSANLVIVYVSEAFLRQAIRPRSRATALSGHSEQPLEFPPHVRLDRSNIASALYEYAISGRRLAQDELLIDVANLAACFVLNARSAARRISAARPAARHELFRRVSIARADIESDPLSATSLVALASSAALSPFHLLRTFAQAFGETPGQMRRRLLIERAKALLCGSDLPIGRIASATGFESHAAFCRAFRRMTGCAPTTYRSQIPVSPATESVGEVLMSGCRPYCVTCNQTQQPERLPAIA